VAIYNPIYYPPGNPYTSTNDSADEVTYEGPGSSASRHDPHQNNQFFDEATTYPPSTEYGEGYAGASSYSASARYDSGHDEQFHDLAPTAPSYDPWDTPSEEVDMGQSRSSPPIVHAKQVKYKDRFGSIFGVSVDESTRRESLLEVALSECSAPGNFDTIAYDLTWELPSYLKKHFPAEQPLGNILTLSGGAVDAYGSSCKDYLNKMFPFVGPCVLDCLEKMLLDSETGASMRPQYSHGLLI
jgi:hypothetical protein